MVAEINCSADEKGQPVRTVRVHPSQLPMVVRKSALSKESSSNSINSNHLIENPNPKVLER